MNNSLAQDSLGEVLVLLLDIANLKKVISLFLFQFDLENLADDHCKELRKYRKPLKDCNGYFTHLCPRECYCEHSMDLLCCAQTHYVFVTSCNQTYNHTN